MIGPADIIVLKLLAADIVLSLQLQVTTSKAWFWL